MGEPGQRRERRAATALRLPGDREHRTVVDPVDPHPLAGLGVDRHRQRGDEVGRWGGRRGGGVLPEQRPRDVDEPLRRSPGRPCQRRGQRADHRPLRLTGRRQLGELHDAAGRQVDRPPLGAQLGGERTVDTDDRQVVDVGGLQHETPFDVHPEAVAGDLRQPGQHDLDADPDRLAHQSRQRAEEVVRRPLGGGEQPIGAADEQDELRWELAGDGRVLPDVGAAGAGDLDPALGGDLHQPAHDPQRQLLVAHGHPAAMRQLGELRQAAPDEVDAVDVHVVGR